VVNILSCVEFRVYYASRKVHFQSVSHRERRHVSFLLGVGSGVGRGAFLNLRLSVAIWTTAVNASLITPCDVTIPFSPFFLRWAPLCEHVHVFLDFSLIFFFFFLFLSFIEFSFETFRAGFGQK
jgi:hypothetical protein